MNSKSWNHLIKQVKIFVTVPRKNTDEVRIVACDAGAGIIGNYTYCTTSVESVGTFKPNDEAKPYIGQNNQLEFVKEDKLEMICDIKKVKTVVEAIRRVHPYEEPAIDIVPLIDESFFV